MSFLRYLLDQDDDNAPAPLATADAIIEDGGATVWVWSFSGLRRNLANEREVSNALSAYMNYDLRAKLIEGAATIQKGK
jgi:hypothetical protein